MKSMSPKPSYGGSGTRTVMHSKSASMGSGTVRMPNVPNVPKMSMGKQACSTCPGSKRK
jgi:hypothetical protein